MRIFFNAGLGEGTFIQISLKETLITASASGERSRGLGIGRGHILTFLYAPFIKIAFFLKPCTCVTHSKFKTKICL